jgi:hypothetical protein
MVKRLIYPNTNSTLSHIPHPSTPSPINRIVDPKGNDPSRMHKITENPLG